MTTLGELLREARLESRLTQEQLAATAGLTTASVSRIEGGKNTSPRLTTLQALAAALDVDVSSLLPRER